MPKNKQQKSSFKKITIRPRRIVKKKVPRKKDGKIDWGKYNDALRDRGSFEIWINESMVKDWRAKPNGKPGAQRTYSDTAILITRQLGFVFRQDLRETEGMVRSLIKSLGFNLKTPDYSTLSRRSDDLVVPLPKDGSKKSVLVIADSSGLKVYGEGEWKVRQHGWSKHRTWLKFHILITPDGEIRAARLTGNDVTDGDVFGDLLGQETAKVESIAGDGGYDKKKVYELGLKRGVKKFLIPPQKNAKIWRHGNSKDKAHPRDENLRAIRKSTRKKWKVDNGYHVRSLVETVMFRFKSAFGDRMQARKEERQQTEFKIKTGILNTFRLLGMPTYLAAD